MRNVTVEMLTADAFAPFGHVIEHAGSARRHHFPTILGAPWSPRPALWVSHIEEALAVPAIISTLERHPHSSQTFLPLRGEPSLIVVCHSTSVGAPDLDTAEAFLASPWQGVSYNPDIWHHGLSTLRAPAEFAVSMAVGKADDDVFLELDTPFTVTFPVEWSDAGDLR